MVLSDSNLPSTKTDSSGAFDLRRTLDLGTYKLYARKDADGYPDPFDSFYADEKGVAPKVELTPEHPAATAKVKLGRRAGVVSGKIVDAGSAALLKASLGFLDTKGNGHSVIVDGNYRIVVPSGKDLTLLVTLIEPHTDRALRPLAPLRLEPGQQVYLDIPVSNE